MTSKNRIDLVLFRSKYLRVAAGRKDFELPLCPNNLAFLFALFNMTVSVNIIYNCHAYDDDVADQTHPVRELAEEDQTEKCREENL